MRTGSQLFSMGLVRKDLLDSVVHSKMSKEQLYLCSWFTGHAWNLGVCNRFYHPECIGRANYREEELGSHSGSDSALSSPEHPPAA